MDNSESWEKFNSREVSDKNFEIDWEKYANDENYREDYQKNIEKKIESEEGAASFGSRSHERIQETLEKGDFDIEVWNYDRDSSYPTKSNKPELEKEDEHILQAFKAINKQEIKETIINEILPIIKSETDEIREQGGYDFFSMKKLVKKIEEENMEICFFISGMYFDKEKKKEVIGIDFSLEKIMESKRFGQIRLPVDPYLEKNINFFNELEDAKKVTILEDSGDHYSLFHTLLKVKDIITSAQTFQGAIGSEKNIGTRGL